MRPDLVLNEDDKKRRFKKLKVSVTEDSDFEEGEVKIAQDNSLDVIRTNENTQSMNKISKTLNKYKNNPGSPWPQDDSDDVSEEWAPVTRGGIDDDDNSSDGQNDSFLDPQTGQVIYNNESQSGTNTHEATMEFQSLKKEETDENMVKVEFIKNECNYESDCSCSTISQNIESNRKGILLQNVSSPTQIGEDTPTEDDQITRYIQSKSENIQKFVDFEQTDNLLNNPFMDSKHGIKKITIYNKSEPETDPQCQTEGHSSVINYQPMRYKIDDRCILIDILKFQEVCHCEKTAS